MITSEELATKLVETYMRAKFGPLWFEQPDAPDLINHLQEFARGVSGEMLRLTVENVRLGKRRK